MPSLYALKPAFQRTLRPIAAQLAAWGVTANQVTIATCLASILLGLHLAAGRPGWILLPLFLFARMALNAIDGILAREHGHQSKLGAILNEIGDAVSDAALTLPFLFQPPWHPLATGAALFFATLTELAGLAALAAGSPHRHDGPFGKSDRAFVLGAAGFWTALRWPVAPAAGFYLPCLWTALCGLTILNRVRRTIE